MTSAMVSERRRASIAALSAARLVTRSGLVAKRGIGQQRLEVERSTEALPHRLVGGGDVHVAVAGLEQLVRRDAGVAIADAAGRAVRGEIATRLVGEQRHLAAQHRRVDQLAAPLRVAFAPEQRRQRPRRRRTCPALMSAMGTPTRVGPPSLRPTGTGCRPCPAGWRRRPAGGRAGRSGRSPRPSRRPATD